MTLRLAARCLAAVALAVAAPAPARAAEVCQYTGAASYDAHATVRTDVAEAGGLTTVAVTLRFDAKPSWLLSLGYLAEEISTWRGGELQSVAVNNRYGVNGRIKRQQWDVLTRTQAGLIGERVQSTTAAEFGRRHPAFARHWDTSDFGRPWLGEYAAARPERRTDLDLPAAGLSPGLRTPLALAFYWSRYLPPGGGVVPMFLPGWKRDARVDEAVAPAAPGVWRMALRHAALSTRRASWADAQVSADHRLLRLTFDIAAASGHGQGWFALDSCTLR